MGKTKCPTCGKKYHTWAAAMLCCKRKRQNEDEQKLAVAAKLNATEASNA